MAIKGKKKSQSRGSQARRRPAAAPRSIATSRRRTPWYKTPQGRAGIIVFLLAAAGVVTGLVLHAHSNSEKLADRQDAVERYTGSVRAVLQTMTPAASGMLTAPTDPTDGATVVPLTKNGKSWEDTLNAAITQAGQLRPPPAAQSADSLFQQSAGLYLTAAQLYQLVPNEPDKTRGDLLASATTVRDQANQLWSNAVSILDDLRAELEMSPSALRSPASAPPNGQPTPPPPPADSSGNGNGNGSGSGSGGGGNKKGSKNGK
jgi:hypothetical protein